MYLTIENIVSKEAEWVVGLRHSIRSGVQKCKVNNLIWIVIWNLLIDWDLLIYRLNQCGHRSWH